MVVLNLALLGLLELGTLKALLLEKEKSVNKGSKRTTTEHHHWV